MPLSSRFCSPRVVGMPQIVDCIAVSEPIPVPWPIGWAPSSKATHSWGHLRGGAVAADAQSVQLTRQMLMLALRWNSSRQYQPAWGVRWRGPRGPPRQSLHWVLLGDQRGRMGDQGRMRWCPGRSLGPAEALVAWRRSRVPTGPRETQQGDQGGLIASLMAFRSIRVPHVVVVTCPAARSSAGLVGHAWTSMGNDVTPCQVTVISSPLPTSSTVSS